MKTYQERLSEAYAYWLEQGETPSMALEIAREQIDWEDKDDEWRGSNDSLPLHSY